MTEIKINNQWSPSKVAIDNLASSLVKPIMEGDVDVIKSIATIRALQEALDKAATQLKPLVITELHKYSAKEKIISNGTEFILKEVGVKYDYSDCGDYILNELIKEVEVLNEKIKDRQTFLKSLKQIETIVDTRTGEIHEIKPPQKTSSTGYVITFAKEVSNG